MAPQENGRFSGRSTGLMGSYFSLLHESASMVGFMTNPQRRPEQTVLDTLPTGHERIILIPGLHMQSAHLRPFLGTGLAALGHQVTYLNDAFSPMIAAIDPPLPYATGSFAANVVSLAHYAHTLHHATGDQVVLIGVSAGGAIAKAVAAEQKKPIVKHVITVGTPQGNYHAEMNPLVLLGSMLIPNDLKTVHRRGTLLPESVKTTYFEAEHDGIVSGKHANAHQLPGTHLDLLHSTELLTHIAHLLQAA